MWANFLEVLVLCLNEKCWLDSKSLLRSYGKRIISFGSNPFTAYFHTEPFEFKGGEYKAASLRSNKGG